MTTPSVRRIPFLRGLLDDCLSGYRAFPAGHAAAQRLVAALTAARRAFRAATFAGDFGAAVGAELAWRAHEAELRGLMARDLVTPLGRPFTPEAIDAAVQRLLRTADAAFQRELEPVEEEPGDEEEPYDEMLEDEDEPEDEECE